MNNTTDVPATAALPHLSEHQVAPKQAGEPPGHPTQDQVDGQTDSGRFPAQPDTEDKPTQVPPPTQADAGPASGEDPGIPPSAGPHDGVPDASVVQNVATNHGTVVAVQNVTDIQRLRGTPLPRQWVEERLRTYVAEDVSTTAITALLLAHRVAVIHAGPGTGRYTTALHALVRQSTATIRQVRRELNDPFDVEGLKDENTGWILDLRDEEEVLRAGFGLHLREAAQHLRTTRSFLIVVIPTSTWARVAGEAAHLAHPLTAPRAIDVLSAHLLRGRPRVEADRWLERPEITAPLTGGTPAHAAAWARTIRSAEELSRDVAPAATPEERKDQFDALVDSVVQSAQDWRRHLRTWHSKHPVSAHRNYLLAAATLDGAPAETVYEAVKSLSKALKDDPRPTRGQQGPGIIELSHEVGAELGSDDHIRFLRPGYAEAVVDYFWLDRPHHVAAFTQWTAEQAVAQPADIGDPLADRVTQWATRYTTTKQNVKLLKTIASQWAHPARLPDHAKDLLVAAALDPAAGKLPREAYLTWAKSADTQNSTDTSHTTVHLKQALARALAELGPVYPRLALKRLSELATNTTEPTVADAVGDALTTLWDQPRLNSTIRTTLTDWFDHTHHSTAARRAFLHIAGRTTSEGIPLLLAETYRTPDPWILTGWRCVLDDKAGRPHLQAAFNIWMDTALAHPHTRPAVIETFTQSLFRSTTERDFLAPRFLLLSHAAHGWELNQADQTPTERTRLRDELMLALRAADPAALPPLHHASPAT